VNGTLAVGRPAIRSRCRRTSTDVELSTPENSVVYLREQVSSLPMNGRNYSGRLAGLLPGVNNTSQGSALTTGGRSTNSSLSINGMAVARSFYAVDGIWNENTGNMTQQSVIPNPDSIEEVRVLAGQLLRAVLAAGLFGDPGADQERHVEPARRGLGVSAQRRSEHQALLFDQYPALQAEHLRLQCRRPGVHSEGLQQGQAEDVLLLGRVLRVLHVPSQTTSQLPTPNQIAGCFASPIKDPVSGHALPDRQHLQWSDRHLLPDPGEQDQHQFHRRT
jgi:hypothetical protein